MVTIKLFNTLSGIKEDLPLGRKGKEIKLFICGPTVYDYLHIGNARTYLVFDAFVKYLRSLKAKVLYLQNITDIDDKIIARAHREGTSAERIASRYTKIYLENMKALGVTAVNRYTPATKFIRQIVRQAQILIKKGHVYEIPGDGYYFDITTFPDYGKLAHRTVVQAEDGVSRIDESTRKRNRGDFCVWKYSKLGESIWKTELGDGRPGWHIEDTAITEYFFGPQYDIHGAGIDLKFPHHEAEIAQQESASGKKPFVRFWMHVGSLTYEGKKMSKSLGNFISIDDFLERYSPEVLRLLNLNHHYRTPVNYTEALAESQAQTWENILKFIGRLAFVEKVKDPERSEWTEQKISPNFKRITAKSFEDDFDAALAYDFNTPYALSILFAYASAIEVNLWLLSAEEARNASNFIKKKLATLGFNVQLPKIPPRITKLAKEREGNRISQQFIKADALRKKINALGYVLEDTPLGAFVWPAPQLPHGRKKRSIQSSSSKS